MAEGLARDAENLALFEMDGRRKTRTRRPRFAVRHPVLLFS